MHIYMYAYMHTYMHMWLSRKSINNNSFGVLRSLQQKACRRGDVKLAIQSSLEILDSGYPHPSLHYLKTICVEDKFPQGQYLIGDILREEKGIRRVSKKEASKTIALMAKRVASLPSDRHVAWLCKVALYNASHNISSCVPEVELASDVEKILLRIRRGKEKPTPCDIEEAKGFHAIQSKLGTMNAREQVLYDHFVHLWKTSANLACRLYLYTIVANRFWDSTPPTMAEITGKDITRKPFKIPDYAMDKHTSEGKKRKRGMSHFLEVGARIENPSDGYQKRSRVQKMAKVIYLTEEKNFGTANAKSHRSRARARDSFCMFKRLKGSKVSSLKQTQLPCGNKPASWIVTTTSGDYFVKGPVQPKKVEFQIHVDKEKEQYGLRKMGIELIQEGKKHYLCAPAFQGSNVNPHKEYSDKALWNIAKVLIFRFAYNISDTNLRNVMISDASEVLSVDEMTGNRKRKGLYKGVSTVVPMLFSNGKVPRKAWRVQLEKAIQDHRDDFITECKKYGARTKELLNIM